RGSRGKEQRAKSKERRAKSALPSLFALCSSLLREAFDRFLYHQLSVADGCHVKGHDATATVAVSIVSHHAFALLFACWPKGERFQTKLAIVSDLFRFV